MPIQRRIAIPGLVGRGAGLGIGRQVLLFYTVIVVLVIGSGLAAAVVIGDRLVQQATEERAQSLARVVATMPAVADALDGDDPEEDLLALGSRLEQASDALFVVVAGPDGTPYTDFAPEEGTVGNGETVMDPVELASQDEILVETVEGYPRPALRAVAPVMSSDGEDLLGMVSVGMTVDRPRDSVVSALPLLATATAFSMAIAALGSWWIARRLSRQTFGLREAELARMYAHHHAVLHAVREGLVVVDAHGRVALINDAAQELLGVGPEAEGKPVGELPLTGRLAEVLDSGAEIEDEVQLAGERLLVVSQVRVVGGPRAPGTVLGTVLTMRDHSEVMSLADELSVTRSLADGLRAEVHESANRLHTIVMLVELGAVDSAVELATGEMRAKKMLTSRLVRRFEEPTLVALLLGKMAEAERRSVHLVITDDSGLAGEWVEPIDLVTIVGNLTDNAMDAALAGPAPAQVEIAIREERDVVRVRVRDSGPGFTDEALTRACEPGWSSKPVTADRRQGRGIGLALVHQVVTRRHGSLEFGNAAPGPGTLGGAVVTVTLPLPRQNSTGEPSGG